MEKQAELEFMKDLFFHHLPLGDNKKHIEEYFYRLQESIDNKEEIKNDDFPDDDDPKFEYRYFSPSLFKERSSRLRSGTDLQDMDPPAIDNGLDNPIPSDPKMSPDLQCVPEHPPSPPLDPFGDDDELENN